jgi:hypothetical protein
LFGAWSLAGNELTPVELDNRNSYDVPGTFSPFKVSTEEWGETLCIGVPRSPSCLHR